jgi:hypothetical protein
VQVDGVAQLGPQHGRRASLGRHGVRAHELELGDHGHGQLPLARPGGLDARPQAGEAGAENENVVVDGVNNVSHEVLHRCQIIDNPA